VSDGPIGREGPTEGLQRTIDAGMEAMRRRRWIAPVAAVVIAAVVWLWFAKGPGRRGESLSRFAPLAAELEGIRGVYLYYGLPGSDSLVAEYRDVVVKDRSADRVRAIFRELLAGPEGNRVSPFPEGAELLNTYLSPRGTLYLDWNRTLLTGFRGGSGRERTLLGSIVLTAADNLPEVQHVAILIDGSPIETIGGHYDTLIPLDVADWR
jgi:hypothetical protein